MNSPLDSKVKKQEVRCPRCKHDFFTKSKNLVSCNECGLKFKKSENLVRPKGQRKLDHAKS